MIGSLQRALRSCAGFAWYKSRIQETKHKTCDYQNFAIHLSASTVFTATWQTLWYFFLFSARGRGKGRRRPSRWREGRWLFFWRHSEWEVSEEAGWGGRGRANLYFFGGKTPIKATLRILWGIFCRESCLCFLRLLFLRPSNKTLYNKHKNSLTRLFVVLEVIFASRG